MIKLDVQDYYHRCPHFEAEVTGGPSMLYSTDEQISEIIMADTVIKCIRSEQCTWAMAESLRCRLGKSRDKGENCCG